MDTLELQSLWHRYNDKLEQSIKLNLRLLQAVEGEKVTASFRAVIRFKIFGIVVGVLWNLLLGNLLYHYHSEPVFVVCVLLIMMFTITAIAFYIYQIILIGQIDLKDNIVETQRKLAILQASVIRSTRIQFLQTPLYCIFFITKVMIANAGVLFWTVEAIVVAVFIALTVWLFKNISTLNKDKRWVKMILKGEGGASIAKAVEFMKSIEEFKKETN